MSDAYPRYTISGDRKFQEPGIIAYRVSHARALAVGEGEAAMSRPFTVTEHATPPRFRIKVAKHRPSVNPVKLADRNRPAFVGQYRTIEAACRAMDNIIRRERGMPERIGITPADVRERMSA
jgi:hypothetical protein